MYIRTDESFNFHKMITVKHTIVKNLEFVDVSLTQKVTHLGRVGVGSDGSV